MNPPHDHHHPPALHDSHATSHVHTDTAPPAHPHGHDASLNQVAMMATLHCLSGCAVGEIAGMALGTALGWTPTATVVAATALAFTSGYLLTVWPLRRSGMALRQALGVALAADTASIAVMEVADNLTMLFLPGAMSAPLSSLWFWVSLAVALGLGGLAAFPVNRWLIAQGRGHAVVHGHH